jgi:hypothetical protein
MVAFNYLPETDRWALAYWVLELKAKGAAALPPAAAGAKDAGVAPAAAVDAGTAGKKKAAPKK